MKLTLPLHPSKRHPLTGEPLQAIWVRPDGRVMWPILGGAPEPPKPDDKPEPPKPDDKPEPPKPDDDDKNAKDDSGKDLGYPKDTPVAEMTDKQQAAYFKHNSRKHEGRVKELLGDRTPEEAKRALEEYDRLQREKQTPSEQAISDAKKEGEQAGRAAARRESAIAIFRGALETGGLSGDELDETVDALNVDKFIDDNGVNTTKLTNFAKKFTSGKEDSGRRRDFGGGRRQDGQPTRGSAGKAEAERRFKKKTTQGE